MNDINKKEKGTEYEGIAVRYLLENNYEILATNFVCKHGEIDIVARDIQDDYIVFIEVKYRSNNRFGMPQESVDIRKQQRIIYSSRVYIYKNKLCEYDKYRYDVISFYKGELRHIKDAFYV